MNVLVVVMILIVIASAHGGGRHGPRGKGEVQWNKPINPNTNITSSLQFLPVYRADNISLQNLNSMLSIKEGESVFLFPRPREAPHKDGRRPPQALTSYIKLFYNSNSTTQFSLEYGTVQIPSNFNKLGSESDEDMLK